jgi:REP element-mobilizing transposase RayT
MSHTYCCSLFHCVFSTKERRKTIAPEIQARLGAYMGGIAREHNMKALAIGGTSDHVHLLLSLPSTLAIAKAMREIKSASSHWMRDTCAMEFEW